MMATAPAPAPAQAPAPVTAKAPATATAKAPAPAPLPAKATASAPQDFQKELAMEPGAELATYTAAAKETLPDMGMVVDGIKGDSSKELGKT